MGGDALAAVILDGSDVNLEQVHSGMAWVYDRYVIQTGADIQATYRQAESEARAQGAAFGAILVAFSFLFAMQLTV